MITMSLMLMLGLATIAMTDKQTRESGTERVRESSFNLAEGALQQQSFLLGGRGGRRLDRRPAARVHVQFQSRSDDERRCPTPSSLGCGTGAFDEHDYKTAAAWTTKVRDNSAVNDPGLHVRRSTRPAGALGRQWRRLHLG